MGKHKIIKSAAAVALTASVVVTAAPGASAASYKTNAKDQLVHTSTGKLVKGWKVFGGKLYKNGKLAPAKKYKIIGTGAAQKLFYGPTLKKGYKTASSKTLLFKDGKLADGWKQAGKGERLYKNGKLDKGYTVYTNVEGDKFLYQNGYLKKGQKTANRGGETLLFVDGKLAKGYVLHEASKTLFNNGKVAEGLVKYPEKDGKFYNDGKLANGEINGATYKDGVLVAKDVASVKAINDTTVEVTFKKDQKDVKASDFKIEGLEVKNAATKQGDDKVVILTTSKQEAGKEYTLVHKEADTKTFTAKSEVIPTAISTSTASVQGTVGKEVTLKAQVTVAEGQSKAGIPVTFNIDGDERSLNKDIVAETYTDENGVATYSYTQYNTASDTVAIYATGKPADRALATVYWGVKEQLTVVEDDKKGSTVANGDSKQYKVTAVNPATGKPAANKDLKVTFAENINVTPEKKSDAIVKDHQTGLSTNPYELADGTVKQAATVKTDENGVAIFTVTGSNTKVTPIVYSDANTANKLDDRDLQVTAPSITFQGAQVTHKLTLTPATTDKYTAVLDSDNDNGRVYKLAVLDKDGKPYAGGKVNLAFNESIDKVSTTNTTATFANVKDATNVNTVAGKTTIVLDAKGEASFVVKSSNEGDYATPVAWIDQNVDVNSQGGVLEDGEPSITGEITYFQKILLAGSALDVFNGATLVKTGSVKATDTATFEYIATNQSGNEFKTNVPATGAGKTVTYTITNTGSNAVEYTIPAGTVTPAGQSTGTIEVGGSRTITVKTTSNTDNKVNIKSADSSSAASVKVEAKGETEITKDGVPTTKFLGTQTQTLSFTKVLSVKETAIAQINTLGGKAGVTTYNNAGFADVNASNLDAVQDAVATALKAKPAGEVLTEAELEAAVEKGLEAAATAAATAKVVAYEELALDTSANIATAEASKAGTKEGATAAVNALHAGTVKTDLLDRIATKDTAIDTAATVASVTVADANILATVPSTVQVEAVAKNAAGVELTTGLTYTWTVTAATDAATPSLVTANVNQLVFSSPIVKNPTITKVSVVDVGDNYTVQAVVTKGSVTKTVTATVTAN